MGGRRNPQVLQFGLAKSVSCTEVASGCFNIGGILKCWVMGRYIDLYRPDEWDYNPNLVTSGLQMVGWE